MRVRPSASRQGFLKVFDAHDRVCVERVFPGGSSSTERDALYGDPSCLYQVRHVDRARLRRLYPKADGAIEDATAGDDWQLCTRSPVDWTRRTWSASSRRGTCPAGLIPAMKACRGDLRRRAVRRTGRRVLPFASVSSALGVARRAHRTSAVSSSKSTDRSRTSVPPVVDGQPRALPVGRLAIVNHLELTVEYPHAATSASSRRQRDLPTLTTHARASERCGRPTRARPGSTPCPRTSRASASWLRADVRRDAHRGRTADRSPARAHRKPRPGYDVVCRGRDRIERIAGKTSILTLTSTRFSASPYRPCRTHQQAASRRSKTSSTPGSSTRTSFLELADFPDLESACKRCHGSRAT